MKILLHPMNICARGGFVYSHDVIVSRKIYMNHTSTGMRCIAAMLCLSATLFAQQDQVPAAADPTKTATESLASLPTTAEVVPASPIDKRIFGVLPNYRTADGTVNFEPISAKRKLYIGFKDSFDYPIFATSAFYAGLYHLEDTHPQFGQGTKGFASRYGTTVADLAIGNYLTESIFPVILKQDPRYFRVGAVYGKVGKRAIYALTRVFICKSDAGKDVFNYSEVLGNSTSVAISNLYYSDNRSVATNMVGLGTQIGTDAFSNVLKEFWPDIKRKFFNKKNKVD